MGEPIGCLVGQPIGKEGVPSGIVVANSWPVDVSTAVPLDPGTEEEVIPKFGLSMIGGSPEDVAIEREACFRS